MQTLDIALLDHIILAEEPGAYYSMADNAQV
ncbi:MAG: JAB domain-containing protein [Cyclobacteriaceae bacterium]